MTINGIIRAGLDTDDHHLMLKELELLPIRLEEVTRYCWNCESKDHRTEDCEMPSEDMMSFDETSSSDIDDLVVKIRRAGSHPTFLGMRKGFNKARNKTSNSLRGDREQGPSMTAAAASNPSPSVGRDVSVGTAALDKLEHLAGKGGKASSKKRAKARVSGVDELEVLASATIRPTK